MESRNIIDDPVDQLHSTRNNRNLRLRRLSGSRGGDDKLDNAVRSTRSRRPAKRRRALGKNKQARKLGDGKSLSCLSSYYYLFTPFTRRNPTSRTPLIFLSYKARYTADTLAAPEYGKGPRDIAFVGFYALVLFFAREFAMQEVLRPLAVSLGITSRRKQGRFNEQAYVALYTGLVGPLGLYVMYRSPTWYFSTAGMYAAYPHTTHAAAAKFYYLVQAAFWAQQALVMVLGSRRGAGISGSSSSTTSSPCR